MDREEQAAKFSQNPARIRDFFATTGGAGFSLCWIRFANEMASLPSICTHDARQTARVSRQEQLPGVR